MKGSGNLKLKTVLYCSMQQSPVQIVPIVVLFLDVGSNAIAEEGGGSPGSMSSID